MSSSHSSEYSSSPPYPQEKLSPICPARERLNQYLKFRIRVCLSPVSFPPHKYFPVIPDIPNQTVQPDSSTPIVFPPTPSVPSTGIQIQPFRKISAIAFPFITPRIIPALINTSTDPGSTIQPVSVPTNPGTDTLYISRNEAIQIAKDSVSNISITSDPVATLTSQRVTNDIRSIEFELKIPVWIVELSGISTDPNAIGVRQWYNVNTGEIIDVSIHANRWVIIDAISGNVLSVDSCL